MEQIEIEFANYLVELWSEAEGLCSNKTVAARVPLLHRYCIFNGNYVWNSWRSHPNYDVGSADTWWCRSLADALRHYSWSVGHTSFDDLSNQLMTAINNNSNDDARDACLDIFRWGNVAKKDSDESRKWVIGKHAEGVLINRLLKGFLALSGENLNELNAFENDLLMTSATTKLFSAITNANGRSVVMYDGRVGAALGLLAKKFLLTEHYIEVPESLRFSWGPSQLKAQAEFRTRDPSEGRYNFPQMNYPAGDRYRRINSKNHANMVYRATKILTYVTREISNRQESAVSIRDFEKALFMVGYCVKGGYCSGGAFCRHVV